MKLSHNTNPIPASSGISRADTGQALILPVSLSTNDQFQLRFQGKKTTSKDSESLWSRLTQGPTPKVIAGGLLLGSGVAIKIVGLATILAAPILVPLGLGLALTGIGLMGWGGAQYFNRSFHSSKVAVPKKINKQEKSPQKVEVKPLEPTKLEPRNYTGPNGHTVFEVTVFDHAELLSDALEDVYKGKPWAEEKVLMLLKYGSNPNVNNADGTPAIIEAFEKKNSKIFNWLLNNPRLDVNAEDRHGGTILKYLCRNVPDFKKDYDWNQAEQFRLIERILDHPKMDLTKANQGNRIREWMGYYGNFKMIKQLVDAGIDLHSKIEYNILPIAKLAGRGELESVRYLLDQRPESLFTVADSDLSVLPVTYDAQPILQLDEDKQSTIFHKAIRSGNVALIQLMLDRGAGQLVHSQAKEHGDYRYSTLHAAAQSGNPNAIELLLNNGAGDLINARDSAQSTPLMAAAGTGNVDAIRLLLNAGAKSLINASDSSQKTALHSAARSGNVEAVQLLLKEGALAVINQPDHSNRTPLYYAATKGDLPTLKLLWEQGAHQSFQRRNDSYETILYSAVKYNRSRPRSLEVVKFLLEHGAASTDNQNINHHRLFCHYMPGVSMLDEPEAHWRRPIDAAIAYKPLLKLLLEAGAKVNYRREDGNTPLHLAAGYGRSVEIVDLLFQYGAKGIMDWRNDEGKTALDLAKASKNTAVANYLVNAMKEASPNPSAENVL